MKQSSEQWPDSLQISDGNATFTLFHIKDKEIFSTWAGDTTLIGIRPNNARPIFRTIDHSPVERHFNNLFIEFYDRYLEDNSSGKKILDYLYDRNKDPKNLSKSELKVANKILYEAETEALDFEHRRMVNYGINSKNTPDKFETKAFPIQIGDTIILASDGLWDIVTPIQVNTIVRAMGPDASAMDVLKRLRKTLDIIVQKSVTINLEKYKQLDISNMDEEEIKKMHKKFLKECPTRDNVIIIVFRKKS